jgi:hypothetical protein
MTNELEKPLGLKFSLRGSGDVDFDRSVHNYEILSVDAYN